MQNSCTIWLFICVAKACLMNCFSTFWSAHVDLDFVWNFLHHLCNFLCETTLLPFCVPAFRLSQLPVTYGAILVSKFNNILTTCDLSFWCTNFQEGYIFWGTNFLQGYKFCCTNFRKGCKFLQRVQIFMRGTYLDGKIWSYNFQYVYLFCGYKFPEGYIRLHDVHRSKGE